MKKIVLSRHAQDRISQRGAVETEVRETIEMAEWREAHRGRKQAQKAFQFNRQSPINRLFYRTKIVHAIFKETRDAIVVISVLVYYRDEEPLP